MSIGVYIHEILRKLRVSQLRRNRMGWYKVVMNNNPELKNFSDTEGERRWLEKWRKWDPNVSPMAYRVFSHYLGSDMNIVPYEVTDAIVEPILTPFEFREVYNDKNSLGMLFPYEMFVKAYIRRINGCYYEPSVAAGGGINLYCAQMQKQLSIA